MLAIATPRLDLIAATAEVARADVADRAAFARLLGATIPDSWPIEVMKDAQEPVARALERGEAPLGFSMWYVVEDGILRGVIGCYGAPDSEGEVTVGYGIVPEAENRGLATEALRGLVGWLRATGRVRAVRATTFESHTASVRILEKNEFVCVGISPDDAEAPDSDRRERGRLMIWRREIRDRVDIGR